MGNYNPDEINKALADNLKALRKRDKKELKEVCSELHISKSNLSRYENGMRVPDFLTAKALADYYQVSLDTLYGDCKPKKQDDILRISQLTGLSLDSVKYLISKKEQPLISKLLNRLIEYEDLSTIINGLIHIEELSKALFRCESEQHRRDIFFEQQINGVKSQVIKEFEQIIDDFDARIAEKDKFDAARRKSMELTRRFKEHHVNHILGIIETIDNELDSDDYI